MQKGLLLRRFALHPTSPSILSYFGTLVIRDTYTAVAVLSEVGRTSKVSPDFAIGKGNFRGSVHVAVVQVLLSHGNPAGKGPIRTCDRRANAADLICDAVRHSHDYPQPHCLDERSRDQTGRRRRGEPSHGRPHQIRSPHPRRDIQGMHLFPQISALPSSQLPNPTSGWERRAFSLANTYCVTF